MINKFKRMFPSIADRMIGYKEVSNFEMLITLKDGSKIIFDELDNSYRCVPEDSHFMTEKECTTEFGARLRKIMKRKGVSQMNLAYKSGVPQGDISAYVNGKRSPSFYKVDKLAKALDCSIDEFRYI